MDFPSPAEQDQWLLLNPTASAPTPNNSFIVRNRTTEESMQQQGLRQDSFGASELESDTRRKYEHPKKGPNIAPTPAASFVNKRTEEQAFRDFDVRFDSMDTDEVDYDDIPEYQG